MDEFDRALQLYEQSEYRQAYQVCLAILKADRNHPEWTNFLASVLYKLKKPKSAVRMFLRALKLKPDYKEAAFNLSLIYEKTGETEKNIELLDSLLASYPNDPELNFKLGKLLCGKSAFQKAHEHLLRAYQQSSNFPQIEYYLSVTAYNLGLYPDMLSYIEKHVEKYPNHYEAWYTYGTALSMQIESKPLLELRCYKTAIRIAPNNPMAYFELAKLLIRLERYRLAQKLLNLITSQHDVVLNFFITSGNLALRFLNLSAAVFTYQFVLMHDPQSSLTHTNLGIVFLLMGNFEHGWREYEYRWQQPELAAISSRFTCPRWQGEPLSGKKLLIYNEQGYGDIIQFIRYVPLIVKGSGHITITCHSVLQTLMQTVKNIDAILLDNQSSYVGYDYYIPLMSLPLLFGTRLETIPCNIPYLSADEMRIKKWQDYLAPYQENFKIGIAWAGNRAHRHNLRRSIKPSYFADLKINDNIKIFVLQKDTDDAICQQYGFINLDKELVDFADTAACVTQLDLVISIDTSLVHLAGALSKPVWVLINYVPDWRWLLNRKDSPWYPSVRLFRQPALRDWANVFAAVKAALKKKLAEYLSKK